MKLELIKGLEWNADFTVVSDDGVTGEIIDPTDTATFSVSSIGETSVCAISNVTMNIQDAENGLWSVVLTAEQTAELDTAVGFGEDKYPTISNYIGILDFKMVAGNRTATVPLYIRDNGLCQSE